MYFISQLVGITTFLLFAASQTVAADFSQGLHPNYKQGELIVRFKDQTLAATSLSARKSSILRSYKRLPLHHIKLPDDITVSEALTAYRNDPNVLYAEPNYRVRKLALPNDLRFGQQWNLPMIAAPAAWDIFVGSRATDSVIVAILDTGMAYTHPDLARNVWINPDEICGDGIDNDNNGIIDDCYGANFGGFAPGDPWDDDTSDSHGTHLAGIVGAVGNNSLGTAGINWSARIMAVKFLHGPDGSGDLSDALRSVEYALAKGARIINMSFEVESDSKALRDALAAADQAGALVISAAGNLALSLDSHTVYPASIRSANNIAVAASTRTDSLASYSNYGRHTVDLAAPGGVTTGSANAILSTVWLNNGMTLYRTTAGSSMSSPHVTGAAALIWGRYPSLSAYQVRARIMNGVDQGSTFSDTTVTGGRLNLSKALMVNDLPAIFSVSPWLLPETGGTIMVEGVNFGTVQGTLTLGSAPLAVTSWSNSAITATIQPLAASGTLLVNGQGSGFPISVSSGAVTTVTLTANPSSGATPLSVVFTGTVTAATPITKYEWDLGDGFFREINGSAASTSHTFDTAGTYAVRLRVTDSSGQTSIGTAMVTVTSSSSGDGGGGGGGGCFIATAAWGSYLHPKVALLREFRDQYLLSNGPGRLFVRTYYRLSPPIADFIARHESMRSITRWMLTPLVLAVETPLVLLLPLFILLLPGCRGSWRLMRNAQKRNGPPS